MAAGELAQWCVEEHHVPAVLPDDAVAVALDHVGPVLGVRGAQQDVDAGRRPAGRDLGGVDLGATGLDVLEVAPGQDVDPVEPCRVGDVAQLHLLQVRHGHRNEDSTGGP